MIPLRGSFRGPGETPPGRPVGVRSYGHGVRVESRPRKAALGAGLPLAGRVDSVVQGPVSTVCGPSLQVPEDDAGHLEAHSLEAAWGLELTDCIAWPATGTARSLGALTPDLEKRWRRPALRATGAPRTLCIA